MDYAGRLELTALDGRGNARVAERLGDGKTLGQRLAGRLALGEGTTYAIVPPGVSPTALYDSSRAASCPRFRGSSGHRSRGDGWRRW